MISRRLIRIKVLQVLYAYLKTEKPINSAEKELLFSIDKVIELYHYYLLLLIEIKYYAESKISLAKQKKVPTYEDLHPNTKFIDNKVLHQISNDPGLKKYILEHKISWVDHPELIKGLFKDIVEKEYYISYMNKENISYNEDKKLVQNIILQEFIKKEQVHQWMEEKSIYWNDDEDFVVNHILKNIMKLKETTTCLPPIRTYKNHEDRDFAVRLFRKTALNNREYKDLIDKYTKNWDVERIAFMDIVLMEMAIAEIIEFSTIPVKVSLNEYIEIS